MAPGGLVEVRVSWSGHPRYLKKKITSRETNFSIFVFDRLIETMVLYFMNQN